MKHLSRYLVPAIFSENLKLSKDYIWVDSLYSDLMDLVQHEIEETGQDEFMDFEIKKDEIFIYITGFTWEYKKNRLAAGSLSIYWDGGGKFKYIKFDGLDLDDDSVKSKVVYKPPPNYKF